MSRGTVWIAASLALALSWGVRDAVAQMPSRPLVHEFSRFNEPTVRLAQVPDRPAEVAPIDLGAAPPASGVDRLDRLGPLPPGLQVPQPSPEIEATYGRFIEQTIDPENTLTLVEGRPRILVFKETPVRIYLPDEEIATYQVISDREISLLGVRRGTTALNIWVADPTQPSGQRVLSYLVKVVPNVEAAEQLSLTYSNLASEVNQAFPDSYVELQFVGNQLIVRGQAKDALEAVNILRIIAANSPATSARSELRDGEVVIIDQNLGSVTDETVRTQVDDISRQLRAANIVNLLQIPGDQQVMLKVTVAEVNRSAVRTLGLDFGVFSDEGNPIFVSQAAGLLGQAAASGGAAFSGADVVASLDNGQSLILIRALREMNLAKSLAEPTLTTLNGKTASFQAGGQFPVPSAVVTNSAVAQGVQFIPFGVQLGFTPNIVERDRVRLSIDATVSTRDENLGSNVGGSASAGGTNVSGLQSRSFNTTVELREGETLAVAGLIQHNFGSNGSRIPFWGDLPFIGATGGLNRTSADEQELVVLITPQLVHPIPACHGPPLPGDDVHEPNDIEFFLLNRLESRRSEGYRSPVRTDYQRQHVGNHCDEHQYLIGPTGRAFDCCTLPAVSAK